MRHYPCPMPKTLRAVTLPVLLVAALLSTGCGFQSIPQSENAVAAAWGEVENQYQRRADLVPNLVETVKGYATHERETLEAVMAARAKATQVQLKADDLTPENLAKFEAAQAGLRGALGRLMAVAEAYPQLKANENFRDLQVQLEGTENRIAVARKRYVEAVQGFNDLITVPPTSFTNSLFYKKRPKPQFAATTPNAAQAPKVNFGKSSPHPPCPLSLLERESTDPRASRWKRADTPALALAVALLIPGIAAGRAVPPLTGPVVDEAGLLSSGEAQLLDALSRAAWNQPAEKRVQLQYLLVKTLDGDPIEDFADRAFQQWKLGEKGKDNGVLLVVASGDRKVRIETGYGNEGALTDAQAGRIIRNTIAPAFRQGRYAAGLQQAGVDILAALGALPENIRQRPAARAERGIHLSSLLLVALVVFALLARVLTGFGPRRRRFLGGMGGPFIGGWGGGGFGGGGGGGWGGGGGSSGGGGASGSW